MYEGVMMISAEKAALAQFMAEAEESELRRARRSRRARQEAQGRWLGACCTTLQEEDGQTYSIPPLHARTGDRRG